MTASMSVAPPVLLEGGLRNEVRREQSVRELQRVSKAVTDWFDMRTKRDKDLKGQYAGLHRTRLAILQEVLVHGLEALAQALSRVDVTDGRDRGQVYVECREIDQAVVWMHRVWDYYRDKFDQRDDKGLEPLLRAADEIIWSCYRQVFIKDVNLPEGVVAGPAPLAFIDSQYSPATWEAAKLAPSSLRQPSDIDGLESFLQTLPVPVLRLPPWCIGAPWWLIFVAHEVGHNIQRELDLVDRFKIVLERALLERPPDDQARRERWDGWSEEIFADLFSVAMMGPWAELALRQILVGPATDMTRPGASYPAAVVRLALMQRAADRLEVGGKVASGGIELEALVRDAPAVTADLEVVDAILDTALGALFDDGPTIAELCGLAAAREELVTKVAFWADNLAGTPSPPTPSLQTPRYVTSGALAAWGRVGAIASRGDREAALDQLAANTAKILVESGPQGTRAKAPQAADLAGHGTRLADWLLRASHDLRLAEQA